VSAVLLKENRVKGEICVILRNRLKVLPLSIKRCNILISLLSTMTSACDVVDDHESKQHPSRSPSPPPPVTGRRHATGEQDEMIQKVADSDRTSSHPTRH
jgi:hypothetical protein